MVRTLFGAIRNIWHGELTFDEGIYIAIFGLFVIGIVLCIIPVVKNCLAVRNATGQVKKNGKDVLNNPKLFKGKWLKGCWENYRTNHEKLSEVDSHCDIREYFNAQTVISIPEKSQFSDILPGTFTSLGILGTFAGLIEAISGIDSSSAATMQASINELLAGMNVAFLTSIVGVFCAVIFNLVRRSINSWTQRNLRSFVQACESNLYMAVTADSEILSLTRKILDSQDRLAERIGNELVEALHSEVNPAFQQLSSQFTHYAENAQTRQNQGLREMLDVFVEKMDGDMKDKIGQLNDAIDRTLLMQGEQMKVQEQQNAILSAASEALHEQLQGANTAEKAYRDTLMSFEATSTEMQRTQKLIQDSFEHNVERYAEMVQHCIDMEERVQSLLVQFSKTMQTTSDRTDALSDSMAEIAEKMRAELENGRMLNDQLQEKIHGVFRDMIAELQSTNAALLTSSNTLTSSMENFEKNIHAGLGQSFGAFDKAMSDVMLHMKSAIDGLQDGIDDIPKGLRDQTKRYIDQMDAVATMIREFIKDYGTAVAEVQQLQMTMKSIQNSIDVIPNGLQTQMQQYIDQMSEITSALQRLNDKPGIGIDLKRRTK